MKLWEAVLIALNLRDLPLRDDETDYPSFKLASPCPKCGFNGVEKYCDGHSVVLDRAHTEVRGAFRVSCPERMRRSCRRCGAGWCELPLDVAKADG